MKFTPTRIPDVILIEPKVFEDERGLFMETWRQEQFDAAGIKTRFVQDNHAESVQGVLRGLHFQIQQPQGKLVRVSSGEVFDVAVDLRPDSPTFGRWVGELLSAENRLQLWIPPGFAHGYLVLSESATFQYKCTDYYAPQFERCLVWNDVDLEISWPIDTEQTPVISEKDREGLTLRQVSSVLGHHLSG